MKDYAVWAPKPCCHFREMKLNWSSFPLRPGGECCWPGQDAPHILSNSNQIRSIDGSRTRSSGPQA